MYRVNAKTGDIFCETLSQALAASRGVRGGIPSASTEPDPNSNASEPSQIDRVRLKHVLSGTKNRTRQYFELMVKHRNGILDSEAAPLLKLAKQSNMGAVVTTTTGYLKRAGCTFDQVIERSEHFNGGSRDHRSLIRPDLLEDVKKAIMT